MSMVFFSSFVYEIIDIYKEISYIVSGGDLHFTAMQEDIYGNKNKLEFENHDFISGYCPS